MSEPFHDVDSILELGFQGYRSICTLRNEITEVPESRGVYCVLRYSDELPKFLSKSPAGHFKNRDPTVSIDLLYKNWINDACVMYIGKAGGAKNNSTLRSRIGLCLSFGSGSRAAHWGGRFIWQLEDSQDLVICWLCTPDDIPRTIERKLISEFRVANSDRRPFANLQN